MGKPEEKLENNLRILIADDEECFSQILKISLEKDGFEVIEVVDTGRKAVDATITHKPDCLILDIAMPEMDGLAALANIKFLAPETRVIVASALIKQCIKTRAMELGADAFFSKDGSIEELVSMICALIECECHSKANAVRHSPIIPTVPQFNLVK
jgi:DNA-binding NarL/FixJ family response regulator